MGAPGGMSSKAKIGIVVALIAAVILGYFAWKDQREFRNRRAGRTPVATAPLPPTPAPATPAQGTQVGSEQWARMRIIGRWSTGNCSSSSHFRIDGTTFSTNGTQSLSGRWTYQNRHLIVVEPNATTDLELISIGDDEMVTGFQGRQQRWRRC